MSYTDIFAAAKEGTVDDVKSFIDKGVDVNSQDKYGQIPLRVVEILYIYAMARCYEKIY